jgi:toxin-antitoxin system PIN domain toxin
VIAVDTNILLHGHREDSPWHEQAADRIRALAEGRAPWAIPWPCVHEFLAIVTHPRIYVPPTPLSKALEQVGAWMESPSLAVLAEGPGYWPRFDELAAGGRIAGPQVHDAGVAALCLFHGIRELWTADRDFSRYSSLVTRNPLVA